MIWEVIVPKFCRTRLSHPGRRLAALVVRPEKKENNYKLPS